MQTCPQCGRELDGWSGVCQHCAAVAAPADPKAIAPADLKRDASAPTLVSDVRLSDGLPTQDEVVAPKAPTAPAAAKKTVPAKKLGSWQLGALATAVLVIGAVAIMLSWPRADVVQPASQPVAGAANLAPQPKIANPVQKTEAPRAAAPPAALATASSPAALPTAAAPAAASPAAPARPKWVQTPQPKWTTDKYRTITFELEAENDVAVWMKRVRPTLAVRCLSRQTEVFVVTDTAASFEPMADRHTVRLGFDGEAPTTEQWSDSSDHRELFAPEGAGLAQRIAGANHLQFTFTPFNASPVKVEFDVRGFAAPLQSIAKMCGPAPKRAANDRQPKLVDAH